MTYIWQHKNWPKFDYQSPHIEPMLLEFSERAGRIDGLLTGLNSDEKINAIIHMMVSEAIKTSEIEGEYLSRADVMSSIRNNLGISDHTEHIKDQRAEGAAELMLDLRNNYTVDLSEDILFRWHKMLMKGNKRIEVGQWRTHEDPMQVISGPIGKETVHFEAPPSNRIPHEMSQFINWFNKTKGTDAINKPPIRSAIAHIYFETIHPFEDGNGRIGRAISEKALSQGVGRPIMVSLSKTIEANKNAYYDALKVAQRSDGNITEWVEYFIKVIIDAQIETEQQIDFVLRKAKFFDKYQDHMNDRQLRVVQRMLEHGQNSFEGGMSAKKYMKIAKTSKPTATRDLQDLAEKGALKIIGAGRSTRYEIAVL